MIPDKAPEEDVFHGSELLKKEAHISSFEKYRELYLKSIENPNGESSSSTYKNTISLLQLIHLTILHRTARDQGHFSKMYFPYFCSIS